MENIISKFKDFFEDVIATSESSGKAEVQCFIPVKDLRDLTRFLESNMHLEDKCVAPKENKLVVRECELADTVAGMTSPDYKERFKAEYYQTKIRYERLKKFNTTIEAARLTYDYGAEKQVVMPKHDCPDELLRRQQRAMGEYLGILEVRAVIEGIDL